MTVAELLDELDARNIALFVDGPNALRTQSPEGAIDDALRAEIREHKAELIGRLQSKAVDPDQERRLLEWCRNSLPFTETPWHGRHEGKGKRRPPPWKYLDLRSPRPKINLIVRGEFLPTTLVKATEIPETAEEYFAGYGVWWRIEECWRRTPASEE